MLSRATVVTWKLFATMVRETGSGDREEALRFFRKRNFHKLDAAIFLSRKIETSGDLLVKRRPPAE